MSGSRCREGVALSGLRYHHLVEFNEYVGSSNGCISLPVGLLIMSLIANVLVGLHIIDHHVVLRKLKPIRGRVDGFFSLGGRRRWVVLCSSLVVIVLCRALVVVARVVGLGVPRSRPDRLDEERVAILARTLVVLIHWLYGFNIGDEVLHGHLEARLVLLSVGPVRVGGHITAKVLALRKHCLLMERYPVDARAISDLVGGHKCAVVAAENHWLLR